MTFPPAVIFPPGYVSLIPAVIRFDLSAVIIFAGVFLVFKDEIQSYVKNKKKVYFLEK